MQTKKKNLRTTITNFKNIFGFLLWPRQKNSLILLSETTKRNPYKIYETTVSRHWLSGKKNRNPDRQETNMASSTNGPGLWPNITQNRFLSKRNYQEQRSFHNDKGVNLSRYNNLIYAPSKNFKMDEEKTKNCNEKETNSVTAVFNNSLKNGPNT